MKRLGLSMAILTFSALVVLTAPVATAQDMVKVAPKNCTVVLDNDRVRVVSVVIKPGEKLEMHSHAAHIVYALTSGKTKYAFSDGKTEEREVKAGQAVWSDGVTHSAENIATTESRALVIELKK
jgi:quercetin dioxygenase-like cupin family protein